VFAEMHRMGYGGSLVFAGPDPHYGSARESIAAELHRAGTASADVHFLSVVDDHEKWRLLAEADAVVYPSVVEGFGLIPFESANAGTPCLMHRSTAAEEIFGEHVVLAENWDESEWASVLFRWHVNHEEATNQVDAILERAQQLTWDSAAKTFTDFASIIVGMPKNMPAGSAFEGGYLEQYPTLRWKRTPAQRFARFARRSASFTRRKILRYTGKT
jgi:glycosyltransferase involved in cell wall biosynthesis